VARTVTEVILKVVLFLVALNLHGLLQTEVRSVRQAKEN
jgi:hypothetical protein